MLCSRLIAATLGIMTSVSVVAATPGADLPTPGGGEIAGFIGSLLVVIASILAFGWLYARFRPGMNQSSELIRLVAMRPVGPKERLLVVEVAGEQLLVGVSASGMRTLHTLTGRVEKDAAKTAVDAHPFAARLKGFLGEATK